MLTELNLTVTVNSNGLFSRTTWVSWYQKCKTSLDLNEAKDYWVLGRHWRQLDHMQPICTSLQPGCTSWCSTNRVISTEGNVK